MDVIKTVANYWRANNPLLMLVSEETYQVQTAVEKAVDEINRDRQKKNHKKRARLILHDPLVGLHYGRWQVRATTSGAGPVGSRDALANFIDPKESIQVSDQEMPVAPIDDAIILLKGWETLWVPQEPSSFDTIQMLSNILQGNLCSPRTAKVGDLDRDTLQAAREAGLVDGDRVTVRGRRMIVLLSKNEWVPQDLPEIKPIVVPLPTKEEFRPLVDKQWAAMEQASAQSKRDHFNGANSPEFKERVLSTLMGFSRAEADDAVMLSLVEHDGFASPGTISTLERIAVAAASKVPGLQYKPLVRIEGQGQAGFLPGYEPLKAAIDEDLGLDAEWRKKHNTRETRGVIVVGPPGTGKSVISDMVAAYLGRPQLIWSMGESQGSLVSESERNTRRVVNTAKARHAQLTLDDADKQGVGAGNNSQATDGGVFDRMVNILLTEMADPDCPIFWMINANRVQNLRPELYREGRIDIHIFADLPDAPMRRNILFYQIVKRNFPVDTLVHRGKKMSAKAVEEAWADLCSDGEGRKRRTRGWSGAEINGLVERAVKRAGKRKSDVLDLGDLLELAEAKTPQSLQAASKADYDQMREMCQDFVRVGVSNAGTSVYDAIQQTTSSRDREVEFEAGGQ